MTRKKTWVAKIKETSRKWLSFLLVVFLVAFLMTFTKVAEILAPLFGTTVENLQDVASSIMGVSLGLSLLVVGSLTAAIPFVGAGFAIVGGVILLIEAIKFYNDKFSDSGHIDIGR